MVIIRFFKNLYWYARYGTWYTKGFSTEARFIDHSTRHGALLGCHTDRQYLKRADSFCGGIRSATTLECIRMREGDKLRYNTMTEEFGVLSSDNVIKTYYILTTAIVKHGSGLAYFQSECAKI
jgi:hypothetical protein